MEKYKLFDAELKLMKLIWDNEPINSTKLSKLATEQFDWNKSTTYNLIRKLVDRNIIQNKNATVTALIKKEEVQEYESNQLIEKSFDGSLPSFITAFLKGNKLSEQEAKNIKEMIEEATK